MAEPAGVQIEGARELRAALKRMDKSLIAEVKSIHSATGELVAAEARQIVPRLSGHLERSIRVSKGTVTSRVLAGKRLVPYAGPIHFGWRARNIEPQPFLYDALDARRQEVADAYAGMVGDLVDRVDAETL